MKKNTESTKSALVEMRALTSDLYRRYGSGAELIGKKGDFLCMDVLSRFLWIEKRYVFSKYPGRYKIIITAGKDFFYAYTAVYSVTVKAKTIIDLPNGKKIRPITNDVIFRFASGAIFLLRNNLYVPVWLDTNKNKRVVLEF